MFLPLIKLSRHVSPRVGFRDEPRFEEVWRAMLKRMDEVEDVVLFCNSRWSGGQASFLACAVSHSPRLASLGRMVWLVDEQFRELEARSCEAGHLSVLYRLTTTGALLSEVMSLWNAPLAVTDALRDDLGLMCEETQELQAFIAAQKPDAVFLSFAQSAEPVYLFGAHETLQHLISNARSDATRV